MKVLPDVLGRVAWVLSDKYDASFNSRNSSGCVVERLRVGSRVSIGNRFNRHAAQKRLLKLGQETITSSVSNGAGVGPPLLLGVKLMVHTEFRDIRITSLLITPTLEYLRDDLRQKRTRNSNDPGYDGDSNYGAYPAHVYLQIVQLAHTLVKRGEGLALHLCIRAASHSRSGSPTMTGDLEGFERYIQAV